MAPPPLDYRPRLADGHLDRLLSLAGAVAIEGPRACGKTTTALQKAASAARLDQDYALRAAGEADPASLMVGATPRLIDEWHLVPHVWNAVRAEVDQRREDGQFILTGSAMPQPDSTRHSGAMRIVHLDMRPMCLAELLPTGPGVSLSSLWKGTPYPAVTESPIDLPQLAQVLCVGGWPSNLGRSAEESLDRNRAYLRATAESDVVTVDGIRRDPRKVSALIWALARNTATYVTLRTLQADTARFGNQIDPKTLASYLDALARLWVLVEQPAWGGHIRSSAQARRAPKRHLVDPSLAAAAIDAHPEDLLADRETFEGLFESMVFRDLFVLAGATGLDVRCYQDRMGRELDAVLVRGARWAGIEVKLSPAPNVLDAAASGLANIAAAMDTDPEFLAIVTGTGASYRRADGIHVISAAHMRP
jgi:predicted AAA+ superfamily ATPase